MQKGYSQFCPIAKASEILANRWTPLIMRELMAGMHSFNNIHRGVPLISRAVLVARGREITTADLPDALNAGGALPGTAPPAAANHLFRDALGGPVGLPPLWATRSG